MGGREICTTFQLDILNGGQHLEDTKLWKGNIQILNNMQGQEMDWTGSGHGTLAGSCENCNKTPGMIECGEYVDQKYNNYLFLENCLL
jgi:hypothetical protein